MCAGWRGQKSVSYPSELELQLIVNYHADAGNQLWVLQMSDQCLQPPNCLSSPHLGFYFCFYKLGPSCLYTKHPTNEAPTQKCLIGEDSGMFSSSTQWLTFLWLLSYNYGRVSEHLSMAPSHPCVPWALTRGAEGGSLRMVAFGSSQVIWRWRPGQAVALHPA